VWVWRRGVRGDGRGAVWAFPRALVGMDDVRGVGRRRSEGAWCSRCTRESVRGDFHGHLVVVELPELLVLAVQAWVGGVTGGKIQPLDKAWSR